MDHYLLFLPVACAAMLLVHRVWDAFSTFLCVKARTRESVMASTFIVVALFSGGYVLRLSGDATLIDTGHFLTDLAFLLSYLLIGFAALFGQARYHRK